MGLVVIGTLSALSPILQQLSTLFDASPNEAGHLGQQLFPGMAVGLALILGGSTLLFSERRVVVDASLGEVFFIRQLLFWRSVQRVPKDDLVATGVRSHEATAASGATPRISHYTHDVLLFRLVGDPLVIEHTRWENEAEAHELAAAIAAALGLELQ